jgi:hypothetical protein
MGVVTRPGRWWAALWLLGRMMQGRGVPDDLWRLIALVSCKPKPSINVQVIGCIGLASSVYESHMQCAGHRTAAGN